MDHRLPAKTIAKRRRPTQTDGKPPRVVGREVRRGLASCRQQAPRPAGLVVGPRARTHALMRASDPQAPHPRAPTRVRTVEPRRIRAPPPRSCSDVWTACSRLARPPGVTGLRSTSWCAIWRRPGRPRHWCVLPGEPPHRGPRGRLGQPRAPPSVASPQAAVRQSRVRVGKWGASICLRLVRSSVGQVRPVFVRSCFQIRVWDLLPGGGSKGADDSTWSAVEALHGRGKGCALPGTAWTVAAQRILCSNKDTS